MPVNTVAPQARSTDLAIGGALGGAQIGQPMPRDYAFLGGEHRVELCLEDEATDCNIDIASRSGHSAHTRLSVE